MAECHNKKENIQGKLQRKKKRKNKILILSLGLGRRRVFFLTWLRGRSILGLRISFPGFCLGLFRPYCYFLDLGSTIGL